jgi:hypothetical protein
MRRGRSNAPRIAVIVIFIAMLATVVLRIVRTVPHPAHAGLMP